MVGAESLFSEPPFSPPTTRLPSTARKDKTKTECSGKGVIGGTFKMIKTENKAIKKEARDKKKKKRYIALDFINTVAVSEPRSNRGRNILFPRKFSFFGYAARRSS